MVKFAASPHKPQQRPPNNPERAPVEFFFHLLKDKLREYRRLADRRELSIFPGESDRGAAVGHCPCCLRSLWLHAYVIVIERECA